MPPGLRRSPRSLPLLALIAVVAISRHVPLVSAEPPTPALTTDLVHQSLRQAQKYLLRRQAGGGEWPADGVVTHPVGVTSLATIALLDSGLPADHAAVRRSLEFLRAESDEGLMKDREAALVLLALSAAGEAADRPRIAELATRLERSQRADGGWSFGPSEPPNASLSQLAVVALREAARGGIEIRSETWTRAAGYRRSTQRHDGGWEAATSSEWVDAFGLPDRDAKVRAAIGATMGAVSSLSICEEMTTPRQGADGEPDCCAPHEPDPALRRGLRWLDERRATESAESSAEAAAAYYLYGLDRSSRATDRFFAGRDWYRPAATALLLRRDSATGVWKGNHDVVATSHAVSFLAKGLAPVLVAKLRHGPSNDQAGDGSAAEDWNRHPGDAEALVDDLRRLSGWPAMLSSQEVGLRDLDPQSAAARLALAPVLLLTGSSAPNLDPAELDLIREYVRRGGTLFAVRTCPGGDFETGIRDLVERICPGEPLLRLPHGHPIYRSEFPLESNDAVLWGVDAGCRTAIVYCPEDLSCLWAARGPDRAEATPRSPRRRAVEIGANVLAFAAGREPRNRLDATSPEEPDHPSIGAGRPALIAQLRHEGGWNSAERAIGNLSRAVATVAGVPATAANEAVDWDDPQLFRYPLLLLHGSKGFETSEEERRNLRRHLDLGAVLIADACCGSPEFDAAFRSFASRLYPDHPLRPVPPDHEIFSERVGSRIERVGLRRRAATGGGFQVVETEPEIEGIEVDGRYVVLYSRRDLSCALDGRGAAACEGYLREDATRIAVNLALYALLQEVSSTAPESR